MTTARPKTTKPVPKKTERRRPGNTAERIVARSILLFNRRGLRNVAIDQIAADLKISPGNLTYHFPRKHDLISAALAVMKERLRTALEHPVAVRSPKDGAEYLLRLFRTLWEFRFFFNALTYVLTDPHMREEYTEIHDWAMDAMESDLAVLTELGYFLPAVAPNSFRLLAENMWSLWLSWLRRQQVRSPLAPTPDDAALYDCALHNWSLCQPWMPIDFARELLRVYGELLPGRATSALAGVPVAPKRPRQSKRSPA